MTDIEDQPRPDDMMKSSNNKASNATGKSLASQEEIENSLRTNHENYFHIKEMK